MKDIKETEKIKQKKQKQSRNIAINEIADENRDPENMFHGT